MHANGKTFDSIFYKIIVIIFIPFILKHRQRARRSRKRRGDIENQTSSYRRTVCQSRQKPNFQTPISPPYGGGNRPHSKNTFVSVPRPIISKGQFGVDSDHSKCIENENLIVATTERDLM